MTVEELPEVSSSKRPAILDEVMASIEEPVRKENLTKSKRALEDQMMEVLANIRLQEDVVEQKEQSLEEDGEFSEREEKLLVESLESARLVLKDRYQGGSALARELKRINAALEEMKNAGLAPFGNRSTRRNRKS